jgi:hypothetical protein
MPVFFPEGKQRAVAVPLKNDLRSAKTIRYLVSKNRNMP